MRSPLAHCALLGYRTLAVARAADAAESYVHQRGQRISAASDRASDKADCVGWDGSPLRAGGGEENGRFRQEKEEVQTKEFRKYYQKHKPSTLSEVEFVDTRKPITRATDHGNPVGERFVYIPETVDDALRRAEHMLRVAKERGAQEWPHSRVLARMLEERGKGKGERGKGKGGESGII